MQIIEQWVRGVQRGRWLLASLLCAALPLACSSSPPVTSSASMAGAGAAGTAVGGVAGEQAGGAAAYAGQKGGSAGGSSLSDVTFHKEVEPILQRSCQSCHVAGGIAPFPLLSYAQSAPVRRGDGRENQNPRDAALARAEHRRMPRAAWLEERHAFERCRDCHVRSLVCGWSARGRCQGCAASAPTGAGGCPGCNWN